MLISAIFCTFNPAKLELKLKLMINRATIKENWIADRARFSMILFLLSTQKIGYRRGGIHAIDKTVSLCDYCT